MLTQDDIELIHREIDGENTPEARAAFRSLMERDPEARALAAELRDLSALLGRVAERAPPPQLRQAILDALAPAARASPGMASAWTSPQAFIRECISLLATAARRLEEGLMTKKALIIGTTAVAIVAVIGAVAVGFPPSGNESGTIGGVQQASRYRGRAMSEKDVTISNPAIQTLFQNDQVLTLVKSEAFREAMSSDAFRELQNNDAFRALNSSDAFRELFNNEAFHDLMSSEAFHELASSEAYHELMSNEAYHELMSNEASRKLMSSEAYRELESNEAFRKLKSNDAFQQLQNNEAFRDLSSSDAFREAMSNDAFREVMSNDSFRELMSNEAFRELNNSDAFRSLSRSQSLSDAFMTEASRVQR